MADPKDVDVQIAFLRDSEQREKGAAALKVLEALEQWIGERPYDPCSLRSIRQELAALKERHGL